MGSGGGDGMMEADLVLVGAGHAHLYVLEAMAERGNRGARVLLLTPRSVALYSGMVPGVVSGRYRLDDAEIDVRRLARQAGVEVVLDSVEALSPERREVRLATGPTLRYRHLSLNLGSTVAGMDVPGVREHTIPTRPIGSFLPRLEEVLERGGERAFGRGREEASETTGAGTGGGTGDGPRVVVVGGGAAGVELAFTLQARLARRSPGARVSLVHAGPRILPGSPAGLVRRVRRHASRRGIALHRNKRVVGVETGILRFADGEELSHDAVIWAAGAAGHAVVGESGLPTDGRGFVLVRDTLQVEGWDEIFAAGDCAVPQGHPGLPRAGVFAVRQGPPLAGNLLAALEGGPPPERYTPQLDVLVLLNLGKGLAAGSKWGLSFRGRWVMRLKDWIDRRFVRRFSRREE